jgi:protein SCO1/2
MGIGLLSGLLPLTSLAEPGVPAESQPANVRSFMVRGVVKSLPADGNTVTIAHEAVSNYMDAMTMPFRVRDARELAGLRAGDRVSFRLQVGDAESWIDEVSGAGTTLADPTSAAQASEGSIPAAAATITSQPTGGDAAPHPESPGGRAARRRHPLMDYKFTNELGRAVSLGDFQGQALAITFFFTRCPVPDFCPRLSKNFEEASERLAAMTNAPGNWHFLSFSFDPDHDTPAVLKAYGERFRYDARHWTFLTGPVDKLSELAAESDATFERDGSFFNHNFRTLIIDAAGHLQTVFPIGGNFSDAIVSEILKAAAVTNAPP